MKATRSWAGWTAPIGNKNEVPISVQGVVGELIILRIAGMRIGWNFGFGS